MVARKPVVIATTAKGLEEKPASDFVEGALSYAVAQGLTAAQQAQARANLGVHAVFSGTLSIPGSALGGASNATVTLTPVVQGDSLATADNVTIHFRAALPTGLNIANWVVTAVNQVTVYFTSSMATAAASAAITVVAHR